MREAKSRQVARDQTRALAVAIIWMLLVQLLCVLAWHGGWLSRTGALVHWLIVGVLPPALALWGTERAAALR